MKTQTLSVARIVGDCFSRTICAGAVLLFAFSAPAQNLFVSSPIDNSIYEFIPGGKQSTFASGVLGAAGLAFDTMGNLYASDYYGGDIYKITPAGNLSTAVYASKYSTPFELAFDSTGNLFVSDPRNGEIDKVAPGGVESTIASGLIFPYGLALDSVGNLFVADETGNIYKYAPDGSRSTFASNHFFYGVEQMTFDNSGNLFVACGTGVVIKVTPGGVQSVFAYCLNVAAGLAFDSAGDLFVTDPAGQINGQGKIYKITPNGDMSIFASGLNTPLELAFQPVPEPSPFALLAVGVTTLLVCRRNSATVSETVSES